MHNLLVISCFNNDISWLDAYPNNYIIYDRGNAPVHPRYNPIRSTNVGYNIWDMMRYIVDHYDNLPEVVTFIKGNIFPRHVTRDYFEKNMNNKVFTPLFDKSQHSPIMPICQFGDECWQEWNRGQPLVDNSRHPNKYFRVYNELLKWLYIDCIPPQYITFAPGANYVVPRENILKHHINVYQNLKLFVQHHRVPGEAHLIERLLWTLWNTDHKTTFNSTIFNG